MDAAPVKRDRRIARTQQLLSKALMELVIERGYDAITIQDITDRADVSRATFYLHYKDKDELLIASMTKIYDGLAASHKNQPPLDLSDVREDMLCDAGDFEHVAEFADFYRAMLSKNGSVGFLLRVMTYLAQAFQPALEEQIGSASEGRTDGTKIPVDLIAAFCAGAEVGVMKWWLENDMRYTPQQMAQMHFLLSALGLKWALGSEKAETP